MIEPSKTEVIKIYLESDNFTFIQIITTIVVALIAGFIALYQVKLNTISEARITWIENLRDSLSSFCMETSMCGATISNMKSLMEGASDSERSKVYEELYPKYLEASINCNKYASKVMLYLNSAEKQHRSIEEVIEKIQTHLNVKEIEEFDRDEMNNDISEIIHRSKIIFKSEWKKSKSLFKI